jgi:hypothetical protein
MRRAAWSDRRRALPPSDAMRLLSDADNRLARALPPLRPNALAISDPFMILFYLALSIFRSWTFCPADHRARPCVQQRARRHGNPGIDGNAGNVESVSYTMVIETTVRRSQRQSTIALSRCQGQCRRSACYNRSNTRSRSRTSVTTSAGAFAWNASRRACQSRFLT